MWGSLIDYKEAHVPNSEGYTPLLLQERPHESLSYTYVYMASIIRVIRYEIDGSNLGQNLAYMKSIDQNLFSHLMQSTQI